MPPFPSPGGLARGYESPDMLGRTDGVPKCGLCFRTDMIGAICHPAAPTSINGFDGVRANNSRSIFGPIRIYFWSDRRDTDTC